MQRFQAGLGYKEKPCLNKKALHPATSSFFKKKVSSVISLHSAD
jgi:hypothetical protein